MPSIKTLLISLAPILVFALEPACLAAEDHLVAKVGTVPITKFELQREVNRLMPLRVSFHGGISEQKKAVIEQDALDQLVDRGLKICSARIQKISVAPELVDQTIDEIKGSFKSPAEFKQAVAAETLAGLRASIHRALLANKAEKLTIDDQLNVSDTQVQTHYDSHRESYFRPMQFRASHILIKVDPALAAADKGRLKERANGLLERLQAGEDFYQLAYYNSDDRTKYVGGDLGLFHAGQTVPEFEAALQKLKVGEISDLVQSRFGFHIIKLTEINESRQLEFTEVAEKIREKLRTEQRQALYQNWLESLKSTCPVEKLSS